MTAKTDSYRKNDIESNLLPQNTSNNSLLNKFSISSEKYKQLKIMLMTGPASGVLGGAIGVFIPGVDAISL